MKNRKGSRWDRHSTIWALFILAACAVYVLCVGKPQLNRIHDLSSSLTTEQAHLASRAHSLGTLNNASKEVGELAASAGRFDERIPPQPDLGGFLEELARVAQNRNLQSDTIQPGEPLRSPEVVALPIAFKVRGPFSSVHGLIQDIEHMPRLTRFDQFKVSMDEAHPGNVKAELNLKVFYGPGQPGVKTG